MPKLRWDEAGRHFFETGVSNCVLYVADASGCYSSGVAWSGITKISQKPSGGDVSKYYADNIKYLSIRGVEEFGGTIEAYSYPDEFAQCNGESDLMPMSVSGGLFGSGARSGVTIGQQARKAFGLCYQTIVGNDVEGVRYGKKIHLVYGATCSPSSTDYSTMNESPDPSTMSWEFDTVPVNATGFQPTSHIEIDCTKMEAYQIEAIEKTLFGEDATETEEGSVAWLPLPDELIDVIKNAPKPEPEPEEKVVLSYDLKGVAVTDPSKYASVEYGIGDQIKKPVDPVDLDGKKNFKGWYDAEKDYDFDNETYYIFENTTLIARWEDKSTHKLSFNLGGVTVTNPEDFVDVTMVEGSVIAKPRTPVDANGAVIFDNWYYGSTKMDFDAEVYYLNSDMTLEAHWKEKEVTKYTLSYDFEDAIVANMEDFEPLVLNEGSAIPKPAEPIDGLDLSVLDYWHVGEEVYDFDNNEYTINSDLTLQATWRIK